MLHLDTLVLDAYAPGGTRPLGDYLCQRAPDELVGCSMTVDGGCAWIESGVVYNVEALGPVELVEVRTEERSTVPLIGSADQRIAVQEGERWQWRAFRDLLPGQRVLVPVYQRGRWQVGTARIQMIRRASQLPTPYRVGTPRMLGTLKLKRGAWSFATPGGIVHV